MSKLECWLWAGDFMISGIGWRVGGPYAAILCFFIAGSLIFIGLIKKDDSGTKNRILIDEHTPYVEESRVKLWHKCGLGIFILCVVGLMSYATIRHARKASDEHSELKAASSPSSIPSSQPASASSTQQSQTGSITPITSDAVKAAAQEKQVARKQFANVSKPCPTPFRPGIFSSGNIVTNGASGLQTAVPQSKATSANDTVHDGSAMFDVKHLGEGNFDNSTTTGNAKILKSDNVDKLTATNSHAYADPNTVVKDATHSFHVGDWFDFMDDYEGFTDKRDDVKLEARIKQLRSKLTSEWESLPRKQRLANEKELGEVLIAMRGNTFNVHYRYWPPIFVSRPCN